MCSCIQSLDLLFFNDLDLNHPNSSLSLSLPLHKSWLIFFSLSLPLALSIAVNRFFPFVIVVVQRRKTAINAHHYTQALVDYVAWRFKIHFDSFARGNKNPLSAFVDNGNDDVDEIATAIAVPCTQDNILIINSRDRN